MARLAKAGRVPIALNSDAHFDQEIGGVEAAAQIAIAAGLGAKDILSTDSARLLAHLLKRKRLAALRQVS